jgi:hypothetical protein
MTVLLTGLALGMAGSGHCAGMCGPLVLTLGRKPGRPSRRAHLRHAILYHSGRVATYVILALPAGVAGQALAVRGFGRALAVVGAAILLVGALGAMGSLRSRLVGRFERGWSVAIARLCVTTGRLSQGHPLGGPVLAGAANGLLPCGLVYAAATVAAAHGSAVDAVVLMMGFGLGTMPALLALTVSAASIPLSLRMRLRRLTPAVLALTAALLLARALGPPPPVPPQHPVPSAVAHH